jgi:hypothetical protein
MSKSKSSTTSWTTPNLRLKESLADRSFSPTYVPMSLANTPAAKSSSTDNILDESNELQSKAAIPNIDEIYQRQRGNCRISQEDLTKCFDLQSNQSNIIQSSIEEVLAMEKRILKLKQQL